MTALQQAPSYELQLVAQRDYLLRFARLQLRNEAWAEDAVSETLLAALNKPQAFDNRSQLKTWLVGILKHKVIDVFRHNARTVTLETDQDASRAAAAEDLLDGLGVSKRSGHFAQAPGRLGQPRTGPAVASQFMARCWRPVPKRCRAAMGRVFLMREWLELSSDEICKELGSVSRRTCT
jgi:RNA polymerase sigma-70 factor (TIGR02943 family)